MLMWGNREGGEGTVRRYAAVVSTVRRPPLVLWAPTLRPASTCVDTCLLGNNTQAAAHVNVYGYTVKPSAGSETACTLATDRSVSCQG